MKRHLIQSIIFLLFFVFTSFTLSKNFYNRKIRLYESEVCEPDVVMYKGDGQPVMGHKSHTYTIQTHRDGWFKLKRDTLNVVSTTH